MHSSFPVTPDTLLEHVFHELTVLQVHCYGQWQTMFKKNHIYYGQLSLIMIFVPELEKKFQPIQN